MSGTITPRGEGKWLLRWYDYTTQDGVKTRVQRYKVVKGNKRDAQTMLAEVTVSKHKAEYVAPNKVTVADCAEAWLKNEAAETRQKTQDRYKGIVERQIRPKLGPLLVQKLTKLDLEDFYRRLAKDGRDDGKGLSKRTVQHVHRVLHAILNRAVDAQLVPQNVAAKAKPPKVERQKVETFSAAEIRLILDSLQGRSLYPLVALAFDTGLRRGELCALKWGDLDLSVGTLRVDESLSQTSEGRKFEKPKTASSFRTIELTPDCVSYLMAHRKTQLEQRVALGLGKLPDDALVFPGDNGEPRDPDAVSRGFSRAIAGLSVKQLTLHSTRHSHASRLLNQGIDVVTVAARLGHSSPTITLAIYAHVVEPDAEGAKKASERLAAALAR